MIEVDGLAEVVLHVHDVSAAVAFYGNVLGLERLTPVGSPGPIFFRVGRATPDVPSLLVLVPLPPDAPEFTPPRALHHLALTVSESSFEPARDLLAAAGYDVRDGKHPVLAVRTIYVTDPEGNEVELISPEMVG